MLITPKRLYRNQLIIGTAYQHLFFPFVHCGNVRVHSFNLDKLATSTEIRTKNGSSWSSIRNRSQPDKKTCLCRSVCATLPLQRLTQRWQNPCKSPPLWKYGLKVWWWGRFASKRNLGLDEPTRASKIKEEVQTLPRKDCLEFIFAFGYLLVSDCIKLAGQSGNLFEPVAESRRKLLLFS